MNTATATLATPMKTITLPSLGAFWHGQGGIYAGIIAGEDGAPDYHLIHAAAEHEIFDSNWKNATEAAKAEIECFTDWALPNRRETRLLAINSAESFDKNEWYWTSTQHANLPGYAWVQDFGYGNQDDSHKSDEYRARAVRRVLIIE